MKSSASITAALNALERDGAIVTGRRLIRIEDSQELHARACRCYRIVRGEYDRLLRPDVAERQCFSGLSLRDPSQARRPAVLAADAEPAV